MPLTWIKRRPGGGETIPLCSFSSSHAALWDRKMESLLELVADHLA